MEDSLVAITGAFEGNKLFWYKPTYRNVCFGTIAKTKERRLITVELVDVKDYASVKCFI